MKRLFVENFRASTSHQAILDLFQTKGKVDSVTLHAGRGGGALAYAFVVMENEADAKSAICTLNDSQWNGVRLTVTSAQPVPARNLGFSGGASALSRKQK